MTLEEAILGYRLAVAAEKDANTRLNVIVVDNRRARLALDSAMKTREQAADDLLRTLDIEAASGGASGRR